MKTSFIAIVSVFFAIIAQGNASPVQDSISTEMSQILDLEVKPPTPVAVESVSGALPASTPEAVALHVTYDDKERLNEATATESLSNLYKSFRLKRVQDKTKEEFNPALKAKMYDWRKPHVTRPALQPSPSFRRPYRPAKKD